MTKPPSGKPATVAAPIYERAILRFQGLRLAYQRSLQVPMVGRNTTRLGLLASPVFLAGFLRLATGAGAGTIGAAILHEYVNPSAFAKSATELADKARNEAQEAREAKRRADEATEDLDETAKHAHESNPALAPYVLQLAKIAKKHGDAMKKGETDADEAAKSATAAAKAAHQASFAPAAKEQARLAEHAFDKARAAKVSVKSAAKAASAVGPVAAHFLEGRAPSEIAEQLEADTKQAKARAEKAQADAAEKEKTYDDKASNVEDLRSTADEVQELVEDTDEAAAQTIEVIDVLTLLKEIATQVHHKSDKPDGRDTHPGADEDLAKIAAALKSVTALSAQIDAAAKVVAEIDKKGDARLKVLEGSEDAGEDTAATATATAGNSSFFAVIGFVGWLIGRRASNQGRKTDEARRKALPFEVNGYENTLNALPQLCRSIGLKVRFQQAAPSPEDLARLVSAADPKATVKPERGALVVTGHDLQNILAQTNYQARRWVHKMIEVVLVPLHATTPLVEVELVAQGKASTSPLNLAEEGEQDANEEGPGDDE